MTRRVISGLTLCVAVIGATAGARLIPREEAIGDESGIRALPVDVIRIVAADSYFRARDYTGVIVAGRASDLGFERGGKVVLVQGDEGQQVVAGAPIAELDKRQLQAERERLLGQLAEGRARLAMLHKGPRDEDIEAARANVRNRESILKLQASNLTRRRDLYKSRAVSAEDLDQSRFGVSAADASLDAARAELAELLAGTRQEEIDAQEAVVKQLLAAIKAIDVDLEDSSLRAPYSGTITKRYVDEGTAVGAGTPIIRIIEDTKLEAQIGIPVDQASTLSAGSTWEIKVGSATLAGTLRSILPELNPRTQTRLAVFDLEPSPHAPVAGEMARIKLSMEVPAQGFWLPATALQRGQRGLWAVYALDNRDTPQPRVQRRDVEVLYSTADQVFVRGTLQDGDEIVANGLQRLVNDQPVQVQPDASGAQLSTAEQPEGSVER